MKFCIIIQNNDLAAETWRPRHLSKMKFLILIALTLVAGSCKGSPAPQYMADMPGCNCPPSWRDYPVCGTNGITYRSVCLLACARLLSPGIRQTFICQSLAWPWIIIVVNGVHKANVGLSGLDTAYVGECQSAFMGLREDSQCGYCPNGQPICGSDGVTYGSMCDLQCRVALAEAAGKCCIKRWFHRSSKPRFECNFVF